MTSVDVLGTTYEIKYSDDTQDSNLKNAEGYCNLITKTIVIDTFKNSSDYAEDEIEKQQKIVLRHEITHAFLYESGLDTQSWGVNEEIVDWIALQSAKLFDVFNKAKAI